MSNLQKTFNEAISAFNNQKLQDAEKLFRKVLSEDRKHVAALNLLTVLLMSVGRFAEAEEFIDLAVNLNQSSDVSFYNYGIILKHLEKPQRALEQFNKALNLNRNVSETWNNRGTIFNDLKRYHEAIADFDQALSLQPTYPGALTNKGKSLTALKRYDEAFAAFDKALSIKPDLAEAWLGRASVFTNLKRYGEAIVAYDKGLTLKPDLAEAWLSRGNVFSKLNRHDEAFVDYEKALALKPDLEGAEGLRLHSKMQVCNWTDFKAEIDHLSNCVRDGKANTGPFELLALSDLPEDHLQSARAWTAYHHPLSQTPLWKSKIYKHDKIRIAYVSTDFHEHAVAYLMAQVYELHDKTRFDITALSLGPDDNSNMRRRLTKSFDKFVDCRAVESAEIAKEINRSEIDILIDLNGYTRDANTNIFSFRPAPIQVNYLGYPGTMGASYFDYIIGDKTIFAASDERFYSEKLVRLPHCYLPNDRGRQIADAVFARKDFELPDDAFVFCCFNNSFKILPAVFDCWMRILKRTGNSVLWLLSEDAKTISNLRKEAVNRGIDPDRLVFAKKMPLSEHLARHRLADLFLDTLPYNAHTTASDALWAGLPVLTQIGQSFAARVAASLLNAVGLSELITHSQEEYEALAVELALDRDKLLGIKEKLEKNRLTTPLFDSTLFTRTTSTYRSRDHKGAFAGGAQCPQRVAKSAMRAIVSGSANSGAWP